MNIFVVRLNPDPRKGIWYSEYPTASQYEAIHGDSPMDGFHEAVNFKVEEGIIRGYLPPRHLKSIRSGEPFALVTITAATAKHDGNLIVGIQAGCRYVWEELRQVPKSLKKLGLVWHFTCPASHSLMLDQPIPDARNALMGSNHKTKWIYGPVYQIDHHDGKRLMNCVGDGVNTKKSQAKLKRILGVIQGQEDKNVAPLESDVRNAFDENVVKVMAKNQSQPPVGNDSPEQRETRSFAYVRDEKVVAYVLQEAKGICFDCKQPGPFTAKGAQYPFLEVHHVEMLKDGGADTVENTVALCPNCHRKRHYG